MSAAAWFRKTKRQQVSRQIASGFSSAVFLYFCIRKNLKPAGIAQHQRIFLCQQSAGPQASGLLLRSISGSCSFYLVGGRVRLDAGSLGYLPQGSFYLYRALYEAAVTGQSLMPGSVLALHGKLSRIFSLLFSQFSSRRLSGANRRLMPALQQLQDVPERKFSAEEFPGCAA